MEAPWLNKDTVVTLPYLPYHIVEEVLEECNSKFQSMHCGLELVLELVLSICVQIVMEIENKHLGEVSKLDL